MSISKTLARVLRFTRWLSAAWVPAIEAYKHGYIEFRYSIAAIVNRVEFTSRERY
ncbi:hypothetical protein RRSWK_06631 [Rhodopirellula sp. SWK7]|nr:hypothetical protein RRSWK_06631 [Rhodopirellula sp. SWK7]